MPRFLCVGGAMIDRKYELHGPLRAGTSNPGRVVSSHGGVARNICETLARLGADVALAAAIGDDEAGRGIVTALQAAGARTDPIIVMQGQPTAEYAAILAEGSRDLALAVVAMDHAEARIAADIADILSHAHAGMTVFADGNLPREAMAAVIAAARAKPFSLVVDAVSVSKARRLPEDLEGVALIVMNADEAAEILGGADAPAALAAGLAARGAKRAVVTAGAAGAFFHESGTSGHVPALEARVADVTGAGDCLIAVTLWRLAQGDDLGTALGWGALAAGLTVESTLSVLPNLSTDFLAANRWRIAAA